IAARQQEIDQRLSDLIREVREERDALRKFKVSTLRQPGLRPEQEDRLGEMRGSIHDTAGKLAELARDAAVSDGLSPLAAGGRGGTGIAGAGAGGGPGGGRAGPRAAQPRTGHGGYVAGESG